MKKIELTKGKYATVDDEDYETVSKRKWHYIEGGYAVRTERRYMHRDIIDVPPDKVIDHINGDKLDNRKENLRVCTQTENLMNSGINSINNSGYRGVTWDKEKGKWAASIMKNYKNHYIGRFDTIEEAVEAYKEKARELYGEYALVNDYKNRVKNTKVGEVEMGTYVRCSCCGDFTKLCEV